jgi:hypothetical protein
MCTLKLNINEYVDYDDDDDGDDDDEPDARSDERPFNHWSTKVQHPRLILSVMHRCESMPVFSPPFKNLATDLCQSNIECCHFG